VYKPAAGEGIYLGSSKTNWALIMGSSTTMDQSNYDVVRNNHISNNAGEGIDVKEGTIGGSLTGNVFNNSGYSGANNADSWVDVKGNNYTISGNSGSKTLLDAFQVHVLLPGWGQKNTFSNNTVSGIPGYQVWVQSATLGDKVMCQPTGAAKGLSNIPCS
jgi:parallel beta-helix repeat protein